MTRRAGAMQARAMARSMSPAVTARLSTSTAGTRRASDEKPPHEEAQRETRERSDKESTIGSPFTSSSGFAFTRLHEPIGIARNRLISRPAGMRTCIVSSRGRSGETVMRTPPSRGTPFCSKALSPHRRIRKSRESQCLRRVELRGNHFLPSVESLPIARRLDASGDIRHPGTGSASWNGWCRRSRQITQGATLSSRQGCRDPLSSDLRGSVR